MQKVIPSLCNDILLLLRLVWDLQNVERNLDFWMERLRQGKHLRTMLFGQGPVSFYKDVREAVLKHQRSDTASDRIERRVGLCCRQRASDVMSHATAKLSKVSN